MCWWRKARKTSAVSETALHAHRILFSERRSGGMAVAAGRGGQRQRQRRGIAQ